MLWSFFEKIYPMEHDDFFIYFLPQCQVFHLTPKSDFLEFYPLPRQVRNRKRVCPLEVFWIFKGAITWYFGMHVIGKLMVLARGYHKINWWSSFWKLSIFKGSQMVESTRNNFGIRLFKNCLPLAIVPCNFCATCILIFWGYVRGFFFSGMPWCFGKFGL